MKNQLIAVSVMSLFAGSAMAQSAFAGFYGQLSTGYESNQLGGNSSSSTVTPYAKSDTASTGPSQTLFGGAPLVLGAGYYWQATDKWLIGLGADYSALSQTSSNIPLTISNAPGSTSIAAGDKITHNGRYMQLSNRFNLFITPGYAIDKDKLVYVKAGYSQVTAQYSNANSLTVTDKGVTTTTGIPSRSQSSNQGGYLLGIGYKQVIANGLYGFVEGNYMGYSAPSYTLTHRNATDASRGATTASTRTVTTSFASLNSFQALIGLGYAF